jgi:hypothetical protein
MKWALAALRSRSRALRAPFFSGSLTLKTGRCVPPLPPIAASLLLLIENPRKFTVCKNIRTCVAASSEAADGTGKSICFFGCFNKESSLQTLALLYLPLPALPLASFVLLEPIKKR